LNNHILTLNMDSLETVKPLRILVLGGTNFVGRAIAVDAISRGHAVTTFSRGTQPAPTGATPIVGDRLAPDGYKSLADQTFDVVIDTWMGMPSAVTSAVAFLRGRIDHYIYVSSLSVYDTHAMTGLEPPFAEDTPVFEADTKHEYAAKKRGGELAALASGMSVLILRPGLIFGPHEGLGGRVPWWLGRMHRGGRTLAPGPKDEELRFIDVRDLAAFTVMGAEKRLSGVYIVMAPPGHATMGRFLETANEVTGGKAELVWKAAEAILAAGIVPWEELPCWLPPCDDLRYMNNTSSRKALDAGLKARPLRETITDTWEWVQRLDAEIPLIGEYGLPREKEVKALGA
jgi:2'-hydroxyisoflavone reductase